MKTILICLCLSLIVSGCALGSATAAYSLEAHTANNLSVEAEDRLIQKVQERHKNWQAENK